MWLSWGYAGWQSPPRRRWRLLSPATDLLFGLVVDRGRCGGFWRLVLTSSGVRMWVLSRFPAAVSQWYSAGLLMASPGVGGWNRGVSYYPSVL